jgi:hypothetical protein
VEAEMACAGLVGRLQPAGAVVRAGAFRGERVEAFLVRRIFDDPEDAAVLRRRQAEAAGDGIVVAAIVGGCRMRLPLPGLRWNTCGVAASTMKTDLPSAL